MVTVVGDKGGRGEGVYTFTQQVKLLQIQRAKERKPKLKKSSWKLEAEAKGLVAQGRTILPAGDRTQEALEWG